MSEVTAHYLAHSGIRPPRRGGKVRGVAREVVPGGALELWSCDHDHAPGVTSVRQLTPAQHDEACRCAEAWIAAQIAGGLILSLPVERDDQP